MAGKKAAPKVDPKEEKAESLQERLREMRTGEEPAKKKKK